MVSFLDDIRNQFIDEAKASPMLLTDLANLEKYIAESYSGRSLIELLQNADDACATNFLVKVIDNSLTIVANNGRPFTSEDIISLCRSGSSTKKRHGTSIGYRGIGFKSIVNYTKEVHLYSGDARLTFSRELTASTLSTTYKVPLVRIPHEFKGALYQQYIENLVDNGYTTIFIFIGISNDLIDEISRFDESCLLFLNSIKQVSFEFQNNLTFSAFSESISNEWSIKKISSNNNQSNWLVVKDNGNVTSFAFKLIESKAIPLDAEKAVIHSFMPTKDAFRVPCKINADFSTDPSRTKVVCDEDSIKCATSCGAYLGDKIYELLKSERDDFYIIKVVSQIKHDPLQRFRPKDVNDYFFDAFAERIGNFIPKDLTFIQPTWLDYDEFVEIGTYLPESRLIGDRNEIAFPGIKDLLLNLGYRILPESQILEIARCNILKEKTRISILLHLIETTRFMMDDKVRLLSQSAKLFSFETSVKSICEATKYDKLTNGFISELLDNLPDKQDIDWFIKKVGYGQSSEILLQKNYAYQKHVNSANGSIDLVNTNIESKQTEYSRFSSISKIRKWRSVEENVIVILGTLESIIKVNDVSQMNVGYDAEVICSNGSKRYYEIKSVEALGCPFALTNNEYSFAVQNKDTYYLAIACQNNDLLKICIIKNPIDTLNLNRRVVRWEWVCSEYEGLVLESNLSD